MDLLLIIYLIFLLTILISIIAFFIYKYQEYINSKNLQDLNTNNYIGMSKNMKKCPKGCIRGTCNYKKCDEKSKCCSFDYQCQYCIDNNGQYYLKPGQNPSIDKNYYNPKKNDERSKLNKLIFEQNKYIIDLNKEIKRKNKLINKETNINNS